MTSKERVLTAFAHQQPDRVPINYLANPGINERLKAQFGLRTDDHEGLLQALGVDFRFAGPRYIGPQRHVDPPDVKVDEWGIHRRWIENASGGYWDYCDWPLAQATLDEVERWPFPSPDDYDYAPLAAYTNANRAYGILAGSPGYGDIINMCGMLRTMEQVLIDLMTDEPAGLRLIDRKVEIQLEILRRTLEAARGGVDVVWIGEDLGTQRGPTISLELFRKHIRPRMQRFVDLGRAWKLPVMLHSCGSSSWVFDDLIAMGIGVADTLQPEAKDMAPAYLKQRYGRQLAFHGMISTAGPVAAGSVADVVRSCRETLDTMMPGGGYAFAPTHELQDNSPTANVVAMYETARDYGRY